MEYVLVDCECEYMEKLSTTSPPPRSLTPQTPMHEYMCPAISPRTHAFVYINAIGLGTPHSPKFPDWMHDCPSQGEKSLGPQPSA